MSGTSLRSRKRLRKSEECLPSHSPLSAAHDRMKVMDCFGREVRVTNERLAHILEHPEMRDMETEIERVLRVPQMVRRSRSDDAVRLYYDFYAQTVVGGKWLCIVVKYLETDAFVITAYLTDKPKTGEDLWPAK